MTRKKNPALWSTQCGEQLVACSGTGELLWPCAKEWCIVHTLDAEMYMITSKSVVRIIAALEITLHISVDGSAALEMTSHGKGSLKFKYGYPTF